MATMVLSADALYWSPRILGLSAAAFLMLLAHNAFEGTFDTQAEWNALATHLVPAVIALALMVLAWRRSRFGAWSFPALGLLYLATMWQRVPLATCVAFAGLLIVTGLLFRADWHRERSATAEGQERLRSAAE